MPDEPRFAGDHSPRWELSEPPRSCSESAVDDHHDSAPPLFPVPPETPKDPVEQELFASGAAGAAIAEARDAVLDILERTNSCSAWYRAKQQDAEEIFRSLEFKVDLGGPVYVRKTVFLDDWRIVQPYVAWSRQNVAPGSTITLNAHGAFFANSAMILETRAEGGPSQLRSSELLEVGGYTGGTLRARELTLLHELGHVIDLLPLDAGVPGGPQISTRNTAEVLAHCKAELIQVSNRMQKPGSNLHGAALSAPRR
ncbi:MAG TPA: hypothetical protein VLV88_01920 [Terriglobales bacterium]|nr:hypothetical protein [Terriglobales bacterium]